MNFLSRREKTRYHRGSKCLGRFPPSRNKFLGRQILLSKGRSQTIPQFLHRGIIRKKYYMILDMGADKP